MTINKKTVYLLTLLATVGIVVMRTVQNLLMIEPKTGFFIEAYQGVAGVMLIGIAVIVLAVGIYARICKDKPKNAPKINVSIALAYVILAGAVFYELFFTEISKNIPVWQVALHLALGVATAGTFVLFAVSVFGRIDYTNMLGVIPVLFWSIKLIIIFSNYSSLATIAENVFELAALCGILLYVLNLAKLQNGVGEKIKDKFMCVSSVTFMLCGIYSVPQMILYFTGNRQLAHTTNVTFITSAAVMIFVFVYALFTYKNENLKNWAPKVLPEEDELPPEVDYGYIMDDGNYEVQITEDTDLEED